MRNVEDLPDSELDELARAWRKRALEGDLHARGTAHLLETEARRRGGITIFDPASLDLRPLTNQFYPTSRSVVGPLVKAGAVAVGVAMVALLLAYR